MLLVGGGADAELLSGGAWGQGKFFLLLLMKKNFFFFFFFF